jgi:hypothetical protein
LLFLATPAGAQEPGSQDNSFLLEESYNPNEADSPVNTVLGDVSTSISYVIHEAALTSESMISPEPSECPRRRGVGMAGVAG